MRTMKRFLAPALGLLALARANDCQCDGIWSMGNDFTLKRTTCGELIVRHRNETIVWSTPPKANFISASGGDDEFTNESGNFNITAVDAGKCQGQNIDKVDFAPWEDSVTFSSVAVTGSLLDCGSEDTFSARFTASFWVPKDLGDRVAFKLDIEQPDGKEPLTKSFLTYTSHAEEDFYGLGAQASLATLKNHTIPIFSREQGFGRGDEPTTEIQNIVGFFAGGDFFTTYTAIPQYVSTDNKAFYLAEHSRAPAQFNFSQSDTVTVRYNGLSVQGQFLIAEDMLDAVGKVTDYTGKMPALPEWVDSGAIVGIQGGEDKVKDVIDAGIKAGCPIASVWLQDWTGTRLQSTPTGINISRLWWNWEADEDLYSDWSTFVQSLLDDHSIRTLSYLNPFLANVSTKDDGFKRNLFEEAEEKRYTIQNGTINGTSIVASGPGIDAGIIDLTNNDTLTWYTDVMREQVWNANISGYMADFGEYTPTQSDAVYADEKIDPLEYHNLYPHQWAEYHSKIVHELADLPSDAVVFHRSASLGSGKYMNLFWAGDQTTNWGRNDGIKSVTSIMAQMGVCGFAHTHSDVGGYTTPFIIPTSDIPSGAVPRSAEVLGRWGELAAVSSAVFRSHEGNIPQINAQAYTNSSTWAYYSHNARMFRALAPYRRQILDEESAKKGWPLLRLPVLYHSEDKFARNISSESFYLGSDLYVAPVLDPGVDELEVYLPGRGNDSYKHVWSGKSFEGGQKATVKAPYGQPAVFVVNNADNEALDKFLDFVEQEKDTVLEV